MSSGYFGQLEMDPYFNSYAQYLYSRPGYHSATMHPQPHIVPMFMPFMPKSDATNLPKTSKSFAIEDILRRPEKSTCAAGRSCLSGVNKITGMVDYRFGQAVPYYWDRGIWHSSPSGIVTGKAFP